MKEIEVHEPGHCLPLHSRVRCSQVVPWPCGATLAPHQRLLGVIAFPRLRWLKQLLSAQAQKKTLCEAPDSLQTGH
jgi:hypothetical protein